MMLTHFRDSMHWAKALEAFSNQEFDKSQTEMSLIQGARRQYSEYLALLATINIVLTYDEAARELLNLAISGSEPKRPEYRGYIDLYCKYYLSVLDDDESGKTKYLKAAVEAPAPSIIRQWLPLTQE